MIKTLLLAGVMFASISCFAGQIVATVNDQPISTFDAEARAKLISIQNSSPITKDKKAAYVKEALDSLINDKIKISAAQRQGFSVSKQEIKDAISHLEKQNGLKPNEMAKMLAKNQIPLRILEEQIQADLMWLQVIQQNKKSLPEPTIQEINKLKTEIKNDLRQEGFYIAEMILKDKETAEECYKLLHQGKSFQELAEKHSIAKSAKKGGEVGWLKNGYYSKEIMSALKLMGPGELSTPLKTKDGYLIVLMLDRKYAILTDTVPIWELAQMALSQNKTSAFGEKITSLENCSAFLDFAKQTAIKESVKSGLVSPQQLPRELKDILTEAKPGKVVGPIQTADSDLFFMKCKVTRKKVVPDDSELKAQLEAKSLEALSEKLLKNAKRFAVVEMKE